MRSPFEPFYRRTELLPHPLLNVLARTELVEPEQRSDDDRRQLGDPAERDPPAVNRLREVGRGLDAEVGRDGTLQRGLRSAPVLAPRRGGDRRDADVVA